MVKRQKAREKMHLWQLSKSSRKSIAWTTLHLVQRLRLGSLQMQYFDNCNRVRKLLRGEFLVFKVLKNASFGSSDSRNDSIEGYKRGPPVLQPRFCCGSRPVSPNPEKMGR